MQTYVIHVYNDEKLLCNWRIHGKPYVEALNEAERECERYWPEKTYWTLRVWTPGMGGGHGISSLGRLLHTHSGGGDNAPVHRYHA